MCNHLHVVLGCTHILVLVSALSNDYLPCMTAVLDSVEPAAMLDRSVMASDAGKWWTMKCSPLLHALLQCLYASAVSCFFPLSFIVMRWRSL